MRLPLNFYSGNDKTEKTPKGGDKMRYRLIFEITLPPLGVDGSIDKEEVEITVIAKNKQEATKNAKRAILGAIQPLGGTILRQKEGF